MEEKRRRFKLMGASSVLSFKTLIVALFKQNKTKQTFRSIIEIKIEAPKRKKQIKLFTFLRENIHIPEEKRFFFSVREQLLR